MVVIPAPVHQVGSDTVIVLEKLYCREAPNFRS
jgi:hypothetical protein